MDNHGSPDDNFFKVYHPHVESESFKKINPASAKLYLYLCHLRNRYGNENGIFYRSDPLIAKATGLSTKTVARARQDLLKHNLIRRDKSSSHKAHRYQIDDFEKEK